MIKKILHDKQSILTDIKYIHEFKGVMYNILKKYNMKIYITNKSL
jgi:hypothetical protein